MSNPINTPIIASKYRVLKRLGGGSFGDIYLGEYIPSSEKVAIKFEKHSARCPQLRHEYKVYRELQHCSGFGRVHYFGTHENYNVMVMELLGYSLEDLFNKCGRTFSLKTVLQLADQVLERVETMHNRHLIHRDIKPANFVIGYVDTNKINCIDFGLSKRYRHPRTLQHIAYREGRSLTGTPRYASINNHLGVEQSRRDDLESIGYVLIYFLRGILPWQGLKAKTASRKYRMIMEKKQAVTVMELCQGCPVQFQDYLNYCRSLTFDGKPDMAYLRGLFRELYVSQGFAAQGMEWDWDKFIPQGNTGLGTYPDDPQVQLRIQSANRERQSQIQQSQSQHQVNNQAQGSAIVTENTSPLLVANINRNSNATGLNPNAILSSSGEEQNNSHRYNNSRTNVANVSNEIYNNSSTHNNVTNTTTSDNAFGNNMDGRMIIEENQNNKISSSTHQGKSTGYPNGVVGTVDQNNSTHVGNSGNTGDGGIGGNDNTNIRTSHKRHLSLSPPQREPGVGGSHGQDGQISNAWGGDYKPPVGSRPKTAHGTRMATRSQSNSASMGIGNTNSTGNYDYFRPSTSGVATGHGHSLSLSHAHSSGGSNGGVVRPGTVGGNINTQIPLSSNKSSSGNSNTHSHSHSRSNSKSNNPNHVVASTRGMMRYRRTRSSTAENGGGGGSSTGGGSNGGGGSHHNDGGSNGYGNTTNSRHSGSGSQRGNAKVRHSSASMTRSNTVYAQTASSANKTHGSGNVKQETFYNVVWRKAKSFARPTSASNMSGRRPSNTGNSNVSTGMNSQGSGNKVPRGSQGSMGSHNGSATGSYGKKVRNSSGNSRNSNTGSNNGSNNGNGSSSGSKHRVLEPSLTAP